jgi:hypothetical protein
VPGDFCPGGGFGRTAPVRFTGRILRVVVDVGEGPGLDPDLRLRAAMTEE